jgi:hypothetical protein
MNIRGVRDQKSLSDQRQFRLIDRGADILDRAGFKRRGIWTFSKTDDLYDSSRDELVEDYAGFGPAAFSTYGDWKVVNPELEPYIRGVENGKRMAFVAKKKRGSDEWRKFARSIYDLHLDGSGGYPLHMALFIALLRASGYGGREGLTRKGIMFSHEISKAVVESLPFPVQNPGCVENYGDYELGKRSITA